MTISFIGHGYVGLVTGCVFADFGNKVWIVGHTKEKIERLKKGDPIIYEPGLKELLNKNIKAKRIHFTLDFSEAISESEAVFITVGTPPKENGEADLSAVFEVAKNIGKNLKNKFTVVSCKSTVPVGTNIKVEKIINEVKSKTADFAVASCPEFLREGTGIPDTLFPDRVVIGSNSKKAVETLLQIHSSLSGKRIITDLASAELIKYTSNAMLATKISFANLISFYCERTGADVETVLDAVGLDKRIGRVFMDPGVGYGGSCLPKDVKALINTGRNMSLDTTMLEAVEKINEESRLNIQRKIFENVEKGKITIWGMSFKPDTDDIRFAPSLGVIDELLEKGYNVHVFDPVAMDNIRKKFQNKISYHNDPYSPLKDSNGLVILTEWNEFKQIDLNKAKLLLKKKVIIDGRNIYEPQVMKKLGFLYVSTGRKTV